jgi:hypothetical protein
MTNEPGDPHPMDPDRFRFLAEACGAALDRWPEAERASAQALIARGDPETLAVLAEARALDTLLATHTVDAPEAQLVRRIVERGRARPAWKRPRLWFSGAGLIGAGAAGVAAGALAISMLATPPAPSVFDQADWGTAFSTPAADWSEQ